MRRVGSKCLTPLKRLAHFHEAVLKLTGARPKFIGKHCNKWRGAFANVPDVLTVNRCIPAAAVLLACVGLSACGGSSARKASQSGAASSGSATQSGGTTTNAASLNPGASKVVVVRVAGQPITLAELEHAMAIGVVKKEVPDPPNYTVCIAHLQASASKAGEGQATQTPAQLKDQCRQTYEQLKQQTLHTMIISAWAIGEASSLGLKVTDAEVDHLYNEDVSKTYHTPADLQKYLATSGQTVADLKASLRLELTTEAIRARIKRDVGPVTQARIAAYYTSHKQRYVVPEQRDIEAIRTWTKPAITNAKREIESGVKFGDVAKRVSVDRPSNEHGGVTLGVVRGQQEKGLDEAIFAAKPHVLTGPLHLRQRYYIFEVTRIVPARLPNFGQIERSISQQLPTELQQRAVARFVKAWRKKWKAKTDCSPGYVIQQCPQYTKASSTTRPEAEDPYTFS